MTGGEEDTEHRTRLHASAVALDGHALLILGPSGSGKSTLALELISQGLTLVADDQTLLRRDGARILVSPHPNIAGRIEARHVGLLRLPYQSDTPLALAIDLGIPETHRLPPPRRLDLLGQKVILLHAPPDGHAAHAIIHCLQGRRETP
ncbi:HPr kinase/phosphatase C-terminal domain-containing protein [Tropicimonas sp. TH_r6]|uniref:HPr kinase/phosphorylase n=1 Tax=Tropicimonas sp. TH_r6 TaxID=3082085 RepID=UPI00295340B2|nr:HPr kinase/phosphatase C-terminal domain-containing protein [Tropicimonas sp. TH_r6]MDV7142408.1 HPr kinase/phosphatase C-terminal domain-containing protein [Tropicimonas sp. TH_r6]